MMDLNAKNQAFTKFMGNNQMLSNNMVQNEISSNTTTDVDTNK